MSPRTRCATRRCASRPRLLEASPADLELADGRVRVKGVPGRDLTLGALATVANPIRYAYGEGSGRGRAAAGQATRGRRARGWRGAGLEAVGYYAPPQATFASGCHAAIVEVDPGTGEVALLRYVVQHDCGTIVNPTIVEGQIHGGVAQGIGGALYEKIVYDETGQLLTASVHGFPDADGDGDPGDRGRAPGDAVAAQPARHQGRRRGGRDSRPGRWWPRRSRTRSRRSASASARCRCRPIGSAS